MANEINWPRMQAPKNEIDRPTYEKIQKHLSDINDRITDDDIRKIRIDVQTENATSTTENFRNLKNR